MVLSSIKSVFCSSGVAQVKVMTEDELLQTACEQFLGKDRRDIENTILQTMEGHLRAILGTLSVEAIYQVRKFGLIKVFIHFRANATTATFKTPVVRSEQSPS